MDTTSPYKKSPPPELAEHNSIGVWLLDHTPRSQLKNNLLESSPHMVGLSVLWPLFVCQSLL
ncbi:MAG: hypothetical protein ACO3YP_13265 [bacterium]